MQTHALLGLYYIATPPASSIHSINLIYIFNLITAAARGGARRPCAPDSWRQRPPGPPGGHRDRRGRPPPPRGLCVGVCWGVLGLGGEGGESVGGSLGKGGG
jgi:hypothetical protein